MEKLHQAEYTFPNPQEWIDNAPKEQEIDGVIDRMVEKAREGGLADLFETIHGELYNADIYAPGYKWNTNTTDNSREFVSGKNSTYRLEHIVKYKDYQKNEVGETSVIISFHSNSINLTYFSSIKGFKSVRLNTIQVYSLPDIRVILESELQPILEINA